MCGECTLLQNRRRRTLCGEYGFFCGTQAGGAADRPRITGFYSRTRHVGGDNAPAYRPP